MSNVAIPSVNCALCTRNIEPNTTGVQIFSTDNKIITVKAPLNSQDCQKIQASTKVSSIYHFPRCPIDCLSKTSETSWFSRHKEKILGALLFLIVIVAFVLGGIFGLPPLSSLLGLTPVS